MKRDEYLKLVEESSDVIMKIFSDAHNVHASVNQMYDKTLPYSYHLNQVWLVALRYGHNLIINSVDDIVVLAFGAFFHDAIEDARLTYNDVVKKAETYMSRDNAVRAADLVYALTNEKGKTRSGRENDKYFHEMKNICGAPFLKFCDRIANMEHSKATKSSMLKKYKQELPYLIEKIGDYVPEDMIKEIKKIAED